MAEIVEVIMMGEKLACDFIVFAAGFFSGLFVGTGLLYLMYKIHNMVR